MARAPSAEMKAEMLARAIATDTIAFVVQCWGQATPPDPDGEDFDVTQALYQQTILACHELAAGRVEFTPGEWIDQHVEGTQLVVAGHVFELGVTFQSPVAELPGSFVPPGTTVDATAYLEIPGKTPAAP